MNNISAVFIKQIKDTLKNKTLLIQFVMFPLLALIMERTVTINNMPEHFFAKLFAVMFVGMAPLTCMSSILAEEKEKGTLRVLLMSNVKPAQYLIGIGSYIWLVCMVGAVIFGICGEYKNADFAAFMTIMAVGTIISVLMGAVIGISSKNQMMATSIAVPVMMILSFMPMLSMFNENIRKAAGIIYSQQLNIIINNIGNSTIEWQNAAIISGNFITVVILFFLTYKKKRLS